jgi:hypothetical protein
LTSRVIISFSNNFLHHGVDDDDDDDDAKTVPLIMFA